MRETVERGRRYKNFTRDERSYNLCILIRDWLRPRPIGSSIRYAHVQDLSYTMIVFQIVTNTALCMFALWLFVEVLRWIFWWLFMQDEGKIDSSSQCSESS